MHINEFDKIKAGIPAEYYNYGGCDTQDTFLGGAFKIYPGNKLIFEMSGKICASPFDFGSITEDNILSALETFSKRSGINFDTDFVLEVAEIYRIDIKKDTVLKTLPHNYLSGFKEVFKKNTDKFHIYPYKGLKYTQGLELIPVKKSAKYKFMMYAKYPEIMAKRHNDFGYFELFDYEFLEQNKNTIRSELQLTSFVDMRQTFHILEGAPTLDQIFEYKGDVVAEKLAELMK